MEKAFVQVEWSLKTSIYEVNLRQYTPEGTFRAFCAHLERLADMGVETLWLMPITPISFLKRKGTLGSYYACSSYTDLNPELGSAEDFSFLVGEAHRLGMKVIMDWVANHTGADHEWTVSHPDFYKLDAAGNRFDAHGWDDVVDLDYSNLEMRGEMIRSMAYWVDRFNIDGFRCDMAMLTPVDFWMQARTSLEKQKQLFWLAELDPLDQPEYMQVFDSAYTWRWMHATKQCKDHGAHHIHDLKQVLAQYDDPKTPGFCPAWFTSNHDENSWNGTEYEKYGEMALALAVFSATWKGIPLLYSGQEIPNKKRLAFFDKDALDWPEHPLLHSFYKKLFQLRKNNPAFVCSADPESLQWVQNGVDHHVLSFVRKQGDQSVLVLINFSGYPLHNVEVQVNGLVGVFVELFSNSAVLFNESNHFFHLQPWGFQIWIH
jgi:alpha-amylase